MNSISPALVLLWAFGLAACDDGSPESDSTDAITLDAAAADAGSSDAASADAAVDAGVETRCPVDQPPIIFVHGFLASGDTWALPIMRFTSNGYCAANLIPFDWNALDFQTDHPALLDAVIDAVLEESGAEQVGLVGHSAGAGVGFTYLEDADRAAKVSAYAFMGAGAAEGPAGPAGEVPTLNVYSQGDLIAGEAGPTPGAINVEVSGDHYGLVTGPEAFEALYLHFVGQAPERTDIVAEAAPAVSGRAVILGENTPEAGAQITIWRVDATTGLRLDAPIAELTADAEGYFSATVVDPADSHEFLIEPVRDGAVTIHYYRQPFSRSNPAVYLRTLPSPPSLAGVLLASLPFAEAPPIVIAFNANRGLDERANTLSIDGIEVEGISAPEKNTIAVFAYDVDADGVSGEVVQRFDSFPFLAARDVALTADSQRTVRIQLDDQVIAVPAWSAVTDGASIAVFD